METNRAMTHLSYRRALIIHGICVALGLAGCKGGPKVEFGTVQGTVRVNGHPQRGVMVQFSPDGDKGNVVPVIANGTSDDQGKYTLKYSYRGKKGDGAPVGSHRVALTDTTVGVTPQGQEPKPSAIPMDYGIPAKTPLVKEVKPGDNTIDLDVKR
jgi:hypothetical protein